MSHKGKNVGNEIVNFIYLNKLLLSVCDRIASFK